MLAALRHPDRAARLGAAMTLCVSLRAGLDLAGEDPTDIQFLIGPQVLALLDRAIDGDSTAADELDRLVTNDVGAAYRPATVREPGVARVREEV
jgi:hypothetical protein